MEEFEDDFQREIQRIIDNDISLYHPGENEGGVKLRHDASQPSVSENEVANNVKVGKKRLAQNESNVIDQIPGETLQPCMLITVKPPFLSDSDLEIEKKCENVQIIESDTDDEHKNLLKDQAYSALNIRQNNSVNADEPKSQEKTESEQSTEEHPDHGERPEQSTEEHPDHGERSEQNTEEQPDHGERPKKSTEEQPDHDGRSENSTEEQPDHRERSKNSTKEQLNYKEQSKKSSKEQPVNPVNPQKIITPQEVVGIKYYCFKIFKELFLVFYFLLFPRNLKNIEPDIDNEHKDFQSLISQKENFNESGTVHSLKDLSKFALNNKQIKSVIVDEPKSQEMKTNDPSSTVDKWQTSKTESTEKVSVANITNNSVAITTNQKMHELTENAENSKSEIDDTRISANSVPRSPNPDSDKDVQETVPIMIEDKEIKKTSIIFYIVDLMRGGIDLAGNACKHQNRLCVCVIVLMIVLHLSLGDHGQINCGKGRYLDKTDFPVCLPCLHGTYIADREHQYMTCLNCTVPNPDRNQIVKSQCTRDIDTVLGCEINCRDRDNNPKDPYCICSQKNQDAVTRGYKKQHTSAGSVKPEDSSMNQKREDTSMNQNSISTQDNDTTFKQNTKVSWKTIALIVSVVLALVSIGYILAQCYRGRNNIHFTIHGIRCNDDESDSGESGSDENYP